MDKKQFNKIAEITIPFALILLIFLGFKTSLEELFFKINHETFSYFQPNIITDTLFLILNLFVIFSLKSRIILKDKTEKIIYTIKITILTVLFILYRIQTKHFELPPGIDFIRLSFFKIISYNDILFASITIYFSKPIFQKDKKIDENAIENIHLSADRKINLIAEDKLNRNSFAIEITNGLTKTFCNGHDSLVIGLDGKWGEGKSSLVSLIIRNIELQNNKNYKILEFNPWMFSDQNSFNSIFLNQILENLRGDEPKLSSKIKEFSEKIETIESLPNTENIKLFKKILSFPYYSNNKSKSLNDLKDEINTIITQRDIRLFVFIDDLDRLTNREEIIKILQLIKLNADFKNTFFILSIDKKYLEDLIIKDCHNESSNYLDKIIQVDYKIPLIPKNKTKDFFAFELEKTLKSCNIKPIEGDTWFLERQWNDGLNSYFKTLRDINRFTNSIKLRIESINSNINIIDFLIIEAIRIFDPKAYLWISENKLILTTLHTNYREPIDSNYEINAEYNSTTKLINGIFHEYIPKHLNHSDLKIQHHICINESFERYFTLQLNPNDIAGEDLNILFANNSIKNKEQIITHYIEIGNFNNLCDSIISYLKVDSKIPDNYKSNLFLIFKNIWTKLRTNESYSSFIFNDEFSKMVSTLKEIAKSYNDKKLGMKTMFSTFETVNNSYDFLDFYFFNSLKNESENKLLRDIFDSDFLAENQPQIESKYNQLLEEYPKNKFNKISERSNFELHYFFRVLYNYHPVQYYALIQKLSEIKEQKVFIKLFEISLSWLITGKENVYYTLKTEKYEGLNKKLFASKLTDINDRTLTTHEKEYLELFFHLKEKEFPQNKYYTLREFKEFIE